MSITKNDKFWADDLSVLFQQNRAIEFFPTAVMNSTEKLNALARFGIYLGIVLSVYKNNPRFLGVSLILLASTLFVERHSERIIYNLNQEITKPTPANPYMNVLPGDNPQRKPAADVTNPIVKEEIKKNFEIGLYKDVNDPFDSKNNDRQFYTMPWTTIPNDQDSWAKWLYNNKDSEPKTAVYEDVRYNQPLLAFTDPVDLLQKQFEKSNTRINPN